ncbi:histidine kinase [Luteibacter aegosomatis]|uniref:sensor histidine kinase n=1 Tax=Luteibacter aegosomatis TaxID=2911537 RepID=UPI001FF80E18|nr:triple tyrosine motif-containing protein [Luteibacter aegosomatis]UPG83941.1 histidine kinase [Luteibacter aegosomatis]
MRRPLKHLLAIPGLLLLLYASTVLADAPSAPAYRPIRQWIHRAFPASEGAPAGVWAMTQDADGYLWFGGPTGLFKFDGVTFDGSLSHLLPHPQIMALLATPDGTLWVGDRTGYITRIADGKAQVSPGKEGAGSVLSFARTRDGTLWAVRTNGLYRFDGIAWQRFPSTEPGPREYIQQGFVTPDQSVWLLREHSALRKPPDASTFELRTVADYRAAQLGRPGGMWRPDNQLADESLDDEGALWCGTNAGVVRIVWPGRGPATDPPIVETYGEKDGLTGIAAMAVIRDREGTIWVATPKGIDQFRKGRFDPVDLPPDTYKPAIATDGLDHLWVAAENGVFEFGATRKAWPQAGKQVNAIARAPDGSLLMTSDKGLLHIDGTEVTVAPLPDAITGMPRQVRALAQARDGSVWIAFRQAFRWAKGTIETLGQDEGLPGKGKNLRAIARRADHGLWLGYDDDTVAAIEDDGTRAAVYTQSSGIGVGQVTALWPRRDGVWVTGDHGVQFLAPGRPTRTLLFADGRAVRVGTGILEQPHGDLWINASDGLHHVSAADMARWWAAPEKPVPAQHFDERDGWPGLRDTVPAPSLIAGVGGRLWVASDTGVAGLDPASLIRNPRVPVATILGVNGEPLAPDADLAAGTTRLEFRYTAPVLAIPERARFRYRLSRVDEGWRDVGNVREATYTNLAPGDYTFEVVAANEDGVWSASPARLSFRIAPFFYQSAWFALLCAAVAIALLYALYAWRLRVLGTVLLARVMERERIARELHDTVLQGLHGVLLYVRVAANSLKDGTVRDHLERALRVAEQAMAEGRQRIVDLRTAPRPSTSLVMRLRAALDECLADTGIEGVVAIDGEEKPISSEAEEDLNAIVLELVRNVRKHAKANSVCVNVRFGKLHLDIEVSDDGIGLVPGATTKPLSFGLQGVRERTARWSGHFTIGPGEPTGTSAFVTLPAIAVYASDAGRRRWLRLPWKPANRRLHD